MRDPDDTSTAPTWIAVIPNALSAGRLVIAAVFPFIAPLPMRLALVIAGGVSDGLDGYIARRWRVTSVAGGLLDGIADKAFTLSVLLTLAARGEVHAWQVVVLLARDLTIGAISVYGVAIRDWATFRHVVPRWPGKLTTLLVFAWFVIKHVPAGTTTTRIVFIAAATASVVAAADYARCFVVAVRARRSEPPAA